MRVNSIMILVGIPDTSSGGAVSVRVALSSDVVERKELKHNEERKGAVGNICLEIGLSLVRHVIR